MNLIHSTNSRSLVTQLRKEINLFRDEFVPALYGILRTQGVPIGTWSYFELMSFADALLNQLDQKSIDARDAAQFNRIVDWPDLRLVIKNGIPLWKCDPPIELGGILDQLPSLWNRDSDRPMEITERDLPIIKNWLVNLPVDDCALHNALSTVVPLLVDWDLEFVSAVMVRETWSELVHRDQCLNAHAKYTKLRFTDGECFGNVLNNALLHVLEALAANHFELIRNYLRHPKILGNYTPLMADSLLAILNAKVQLVVSSQYDRSD